MEAPEILVYKPTPTEIGLLIAMAIIGISCLLLIAKAMVIEYMKPWSLIIAVFLMVLIQVCLLVAILIEFRKRK
jgi:hypothetical protein